MALAPRFGQFHISNIGTIRNMLTDRLGPVHDCPDDDTYDGADTDVLGGYGELAWPADARWRPAAAILGIVVAVGAIATAVIINSGDSASTKATVGAPAPRTLTSAPPSASPSPLPRASAPALPPETVTTVTPPPSAPAPIPAPIPAPTAAPPPAAAPPPVALNPRTVIYSVTGTKQLLDLVNVAYTDARGYPQTEFNVSLPWSKVIVLNPGVQTESVVATSFYGRLNCAILNAAGQPVVTSAHNGVMATCTR